MKSALFVFFLLILSFSSYAQKSKKISKAESAKLTQEQRLVLESTRKSKGGKKDISMKKRVKIDKKQDKRARSIKQSKQKAPKRKPN